MAVWGGVVFCPSGGVRSVRHLILILICMLAASAAAAADTLLLANNGKVAGTITRITVRIGPLRKTLSRADIRSVKLTRGKLVVSGHDNTKYIGTLESIGIRSVAGPIAFNGKSIRSISLDTENEASIKARLPALSAVDEQTPARARPLTKRDKRVQALLQTAAALRVQYVKRSDAMAEVEAGTVREKHAKAAASARLHVERLREKHRTAGKNGVALKEAEAAWDKLLREIESAKGAARTRARKRRDRIRAYHHAISRYVATGKAIREKAMRGIFEKALAPGK